MAAHTHHVADKPGLDHLHSLDIFLVIHSLHAEIQGAVCFGVCVIDRLALIQSAGHGLLTEDMFPGGKGVQSDLGVHMKRNRDDHAIY